MFIKIKGHVLNLMNVTHFELDRDDNADDVFVWFVGGAHIIIFDVKWKKLRRKLKALGFSSLLPSTSKR
jgi:hypothetical protein